MNSNKQCAFELTHDIEWALESRKFYIACPVPSSTLVRGPKLDDYDIMKPHSIRIMVDEYNIAFFTWSYIGQGFMDQSLKKLIGTSLHTSIAILRNEHGQWGPDEGQWQDLGRRANKALREKRINVGLLRTKTERVGKKILTLARHITASRLDKISDRQMLRWFERLWNYSVEICRIGFIPVVSDYHHGLLTATLTEIVERKYRPGIKTSIPECVSVLSSAPDITLTWQENQALYCIAVAVRRKRKKITDIKILRQVIYRIPELQKQFAQHVRTFAPLFYGYQGPLWNEKHFLERILGILKRHPAGLEKVLAQKDHERAELASQQRRLIKALGLSSSEQRLFSAAQNFLYLKAYRMDVRGYANYAFNLMLEILEARHHFPQHLLRYATIDEIFTLLKQGRIPSSAVLRRRRSFSVCVWDDRGLHFLYGKEATRFLNRVVIREAVRATAEIRGQVASPGRVSGTAKIVNTISDIGKVAHGDILVSIATSPELLPAMYRAGAFVTDTGGITSHAAIVAREMKKPCIIGTKIATRVFKDGERVEVDAVQGIARKIAS